MCACGNHQHLCIDEQVEILNGFTKVLYTLFALFVETRSSVPLASSFTDFLILCSIFSFLIDNLEHSHCQHERLATVVVALFLIEVLVDHLMDFFVSNSSATQQTVNSALVTSVLALDRLKLRYHVCRVSALYCCAKLCSGHPQPSR